MYKLEFLSCEMTKGTLTASILIEEVQCLHEHFPVFLERYMSVALRTTAKTIAGYGSAASDNINFLCRFFCQLPAQQAKTNKFIQFHAKFLQHSILFIDKFCVITK